MIIRKSQDSPITDHYRASVPFQQDTTMHNEIKTDYNPHKFSNSKLQLHKIIAENLDIINQDEDEHQQCNNCITRPIKM